nr:MAG TPA: hypothetical protein [Caudoviricetes sp.]
MFQCNKIRPPCRYSYIAVKGEHFTRSLTLYKRIEVNARIKVYR